MRKLSALLPLPRFPSQLIVVPEILDCVAQVIGPDFKLSSVNARSTNPHNDDAQPWHADSGAVADERGYWVCNTIWMLDDFTAENGATRMIPRSHTWGRLPERGIKDSLPGEGLVFGRAGTVVIMNTHMWHGGTAARRHGGTANRTDRCRRALHGFYTRNDKPQQQYQKALLRQETVRGLSATQRQVLALDDPENDRLSTETTRMSGFLT